MVKEMKETEVVRKYNGKPLSDKLKKLVKVLEDRGVDAFAKNKFRVLTQAILVAGVKYYPHSQGQDRNKKVMDLPADVVEVMELEAYGIGIEGEIGEGQEAFLRRVPAETPLASRTKAFTKKAMKAKLDKKRK